MLEYSMFERLPFRSQTESLAKDGIILAQRKYNGWEVTLYTLNGQFVELWTGKDAQVISTFKKSASAVAVLEPYLDEIDVQEFLGFDF
ncbi:hypothetical protein ACSX1A_08805 [Pontibacter sp. MBLB2868]|uniref:hypothetical protein n=1 Tax=Pontibacter sp. MBLB2868 TaxID=3451555 RepID=UPI003F7502F0